MRTKHFIHQLKNAVFGSVYYAVIVGERGSERYDITSQIHRTREDAEAHRRRIEQTRTYLYIETVRFRSRRKY